MEKLTENMIHWAESKLGSTKYAGWCLAFIEDALEISNNIEIFGGDSAKESCELYKDALREGVPQRGAFVFYNCLCQGENGPVNWGHCGISLGDGRVIHAWDVVRIDDYLEIEKLTALTGDHPEYLGWVPLERVLSQKPLMYIVKAEANQIEKIVDMSIRAFETDVNIGGMKGDCPPEFDSVEWHKQMAREGHLYQAMIGKDLVGAAIIFHDETKNSVYIGRIFIDSIYHRKGYGIRLMECIEKDFPCDTEFNLDTPCWNERTNAFYKRLGYRIIKIEDGFVFYQKRNHEPNII